MIKKEIRKHLNTYFNLEKPEVKWRITEIIKKIREGYSRHKLLEFCETTMDLKYQQATRYIHDAYATLTFNSDEEIEQLKGVQIERIEDLLRASLESKDRTTAAKSLDMLNRIFALYVDKKEVDVNVESLKFEFGGAEDGEAAAENI